MAHAILSPSAAPRWLECPPSARLERKFPDTAGEAAREGTLAHAMAETMLQRHVGLINELQYKRDMRLYEKDELYSAEMPEYVKQYVDYVIEKYSEAQATDPHAEIFLETRVNLTAFVPEGFGTVDVRIIRNRVLRVIDLKYGKGVPVDATENKQLMTYALGALLESDIFHAIDTVILTIHQPRLNSVTEWAISAKQLRAWGDEVLRPRAAMAFKGEGEYVAGKHCHFCRAAGVCRTNAEYHLALIEPHNLSDPNLLKPEEQVEIYLQADLITKWLKSVSEFMEAQAQKGQKYPGLKLVEGRSNRRYADAEAIDKALRDAGYDEAKYMKPATLLPLGEMEKLIGKGAFAGLAGAYIVKPTGAPTLVALSDKRPELNSAASAESDFAEYL